MLPQQVAHFTNQVGPNRCAFRVPVGLQPGPLHRFGDTVGEHLVQWIPDRGLPGGIYFIRVLTPGRIEVERVTLLRTK